MSFWANGLWANGFWADDFWSGTVTQDTSVSYDVTICKEDTDSTITNQVIEVDVTLGSL